MSVRDEILQVTVLLLAYGALCCVARTSTPVVVVLSGSMHPALRTGDLALIAAKPDSDRYAVGDVVVFDVVGRAVPIVHRIVALRGPRCFVTKGDANAGDDVRGGLLAPRQLCVDADAVRGRVLLRVPWLGFPAMWVSSWAHGRLIAATLVGATLLREWLADRRAARVPIHAS